MKNTKILEDLINSVTGAKTHFDIWWTLMSDAVPEFNEAINKHSDFFRASRDAHYMACFVYLAHLFDKRSDSSSLQNYLTGIQSETAEEKFKDLYARYLQLANRASPLVKARHKTVAHVDANLSEKEVFLELKITWNEVRAIIYDSAAFVTLLAEAPFEGAIGIPRDGRLSSATLTLLRSLRLGIEK